MKNASFRTLKVFAAILWFIGGVILAFKAISLLREASALRPAHGWTWLAVIPGLLIGGLKGKLVFSKVCRRNLDRIDRLNPPKLWQFYRPKFFLLLALMICVGAALSAMAHGNYPWLVGVAVLDLSVSAALLASGYIFFNGK
ncbi:MAG: hypothetical protein Q8P24_17205 [Desulfobacterales bacterium]|nr:hypothetical protein [Desulfobacterales bacterium]